MERLNRLRAGFRTRVGDEQPGVPFVAPVDPDRSG